MVQCDLFPEGSCARSLEPRVAVLRSGRTFKRWGLVEGNYVWRLPAHELINSGFGVGWVLEY